MRVRLLIWVLWPSFLIAAVAEAVFFTAIHPEEILLFGEPLALSNEGIYTLGFFVMWAFCAAAQNTVNEAHTNTRKQASWAKEARACHASTISTHLGPAYAAHTNV
jgi:hypothetical protein